MPIEEAELKKKSKRRSRTSEKDGLIYPTKFPTLASIVLRNGLVVEIPRLPSNFSQLTIYDNMRIALEYAALAICSLNQLETLKMTNRADLIGLLSSMRLNLEDLSNHLYYAIEIFHKNEE